MHSLYEQNPGFVLSDARFGQSAAHGLMTPPDSPTYSSRGRAGGTSTSYTKSQNESCYSPQSAQASPFGAQDGRDELSRVSETIYTIIEQVIEQKLAEAMGPLRLNIRRFDSENTDLQTQNDTLGSKVDDLEKQLQTLQNISLAASNNLEIISSVAHQLSQTTNSIHPQNTFIPQPTNTTRIFARHQEQHYNIKPQFRFERRNSKRQSRTGSKSRKSQLVNYVFSKWRTGGADRD